MGLQIGHSEAKMGKGGFIFGTVHSTFSYSMVICNLGKDNWVIVSRTNNKKCKWSFGFALLEGNTCLFTLIDYTAMK